MTQAPSGVFRVYSDDGVDSGLFSVYADAGDGTVALLGEYETVEAASAAFDRANFIRTGSLSEVIDAGAIAALGRGELLCDGEAAGVAVAAAAAARAPAYRGVKFDTATGRWAACVRHEGKLVPCEEPFVTDHEAAFAFDQAVMYFCGERGRRRLNFPALAPSPSDAIPPAVRARLESATVDAETGALRPDPSLTGSDCRGVWCTAPGTYAVVIALAGEPHQSGGVFSSEARAAAAYERRVIELCRARGADPAPYVDDAAAARARAASVDGSSVASDDPLLLGVEEVA